MGAAVRAAGCRLIDASFPGITDLGRRYRDGSLTPRLIVEQSLARLAAWEPRLNAFAHVMAASALAEADRLRAELASGRDSGPLHGIPVAIKDLIDIAGEPTGFGSRVVPPAMATADAEPAAARGRRRCHRQDQPARIRLRYRAARGRPD